MLANAYVDLGTYSGFTPYFGGAYVEWDNLTNISDDGEFEHEGKSNWPFAYALMPAFRTASPKLDVGYRYSQINRGKKFGYFR